MRQPLVWGLLLSSLLLGGCATGRDVVPMDTGELVATPAAANGKTAFINLVVDERTFEVRPKQASIPSLDPDLSDTPDIRARAIGRKRNSFGKALGDMVLEPGVTIDRLVVLSLEKALKEKGYEVLPQQSAVVPETYVLDVSIKKFWSWMNPGAFALTLNTEISTDLSMRNAQSVMLDKKNIYVKASDTFQTGLQENWIQVMKQALHSYAEAVAKQL